MLPVLILSALFLTFLLFCCLAANDDPVSRAISDREQMEFIREWQKKRHAKNH